MGCWRFAGDGSRAEAPARRFERTAAERLSYRESSCGTGCQDDFAALGLAAGLLGWRAPRAACALHPHQGAGIAGVEREPRGDNGPSFANSRTRLETVLVPRGANDVHDVLVARHAGFV